MPNPQSFGPSARTAPAPSWERVSGVAAPGVAARRYGAEKEVLASLAATYAVEQVGTMEHSYTPAEFSERYREAFDAELAPTFWGAVS